MHRARRSDEGKKETERKKKWWGPSRNALWSMAPRRSFRTAAVVTYCRRPRFVRPRCTFTFRLRLVFFFFLFRCTLTRVIIFARRFRLSILFFFLTSILFFFEFVTWYEYAFFTEQCVSHVCKVTSVVDPHKSSRSSIIHAAPALRRVPIAPRRNQKFVFFRKSYFFLLVVQF